MDKFSQSLHFNKILAHGKVAPRGTQLVYGTFNIVKYANLATIFYALYLHVQVYTLYLAADAQHFTKLLPQ